MRECVFCDNRNIASREEVLRTQHVRVFPTNIPITSGHMLICPTRCISTIDELSQVEKTELFETVVRVKKALKKALSADGFNCAWNEGEVAGQAVPHLHIHIVPRKEGDTGITDYEPRQFLYRPGSRETSQEEELRAIAEIVRKAL